MPPETIIAKAVETPSFAVTLPPVMVNPPAALMPIEVALSPVVKTQPVVMLIPPVDSLYTATPVSELLLIAPPWIISSGVEGVPPPLARQIVPAALPEVRTFPDVMFADPDTVITPCLLFFTVCPVDDETVPPEMVIGPLSWLNIVVLPVTKPLEIVTGPVERLSIAMPIAVKTTPPETRIGPVVLFSITAPPPGEVKETVPPEILTDPVELLVIVLPELVPADFVTVPPSINTMLSPLLSIAVPDVTETEPPVILTMPPPKLSTAVPVVAETSPEIPSTPLFLIPMPVVALTVPLPEMSTVFCGPMNTAVLVLVETEPPLIVSGIREKLSAG